MYPEIEENLKEKLRLLVSDLISTVEEKIRLMMAEHSANGMLRSGNTIKLTMDYISDVNKLLYKESINYLHEASLTYHPELELKVQKSVKVAHESYKKEVLAHFQTSTNIAGKPDLYLRMLPEIEAGMASDLAKFQNELNLISEKLRRNNEASRLKTAIWVIEGVLLLASVSIASMWYKEPSGNYEPILFGIGCIMSLIPICTKLYTKR